MTEMAGVGASAKLGRRTARRLSRKIGVRVLQALTADERVSILWCPTGLSDFAEVGGAVLHPYKDRLTTNRLASLAGRRLSRLRLN